MADKTTRTADKLGAKKATNPGNPSIISSEGAIGKQFNPEGAIGKIGEKIGGPLSKEGMIGSQFDAMVVLGSHEVDVYGLGETN
ncbi:hypothetical protein ONZ43_g391 [Nemania bipapillata]|uniref:Uncharacterized protein n=1 Tax=Nemania bipapillata TaxID=110536 RepID=A0ACC2J8G4_9PEZI|nr:hypothetical protein ONZ43_g391 [Nemania bipapillata]